MATFPSPKVGGHLVAVPQWRSGPATKALITKVGRIYLYLGNLQLPLAQLVKQGFIDGPNVRYWLSFEIYEKHATNKALLEQLEAALASLEPRLMRTGDIFAAAQMLGVKLVPPAPKIEPA
ncbi:hypothetical protein [Acidovorax sp. sic0104]|uniref:hypothetical protein n=1 Tax=Acidovorax sp. sic0104 TaxID=2854784 RepID=UPI001C45C217|nr:hypothetical protein [Acidovorax sp. sic0104]MBV7542028.1 hypothetical protein [Acidovorax sp. sic0104]